MSAGDFGMPFANIVDTEDGGGADLVALIESAVDVERPGPRRCMFCGDSRCTLIVCISCGNPSCESCLAITGDCFCDGEPGNLFDAIADEHDDEIEDAA